MFTLKQCAPIVGSKIYSYEKESDLLLRWTEFVQQVDPDVITGYNIVNFDFPYIIERAQALQITNYPMINRLKTVSKMKSTTLSSKALGTRDTKDINIEGRIQFDMI